MAQRTLAQARQMLEEYSGLLNPPQYKAIQDEINEATRAATAAATTYVTDRYNETIGGCVTVGQELCQIRDAARTLTADLAAGRVTARQGAEEWNRLRAQLRRLNGVSGRLAESAEQIATIEANPAEWFDKAFYDKYPAIRPTFTF